LAPPFYIVQSQARIPELYPLVPDWFDRVGILLVCLDSQRQMLEVTVSPNRLEQKAQLVGPKLWFGPGLGRTLFRSDGFFCGFDALYTYDSGSEAPNKLPSFDRTTESDDLLMAHGPENLLDDMNKSGANGYFADGCGLFCCVRSPNVAELLVSGLPEATLRVASPSGNLE